MRQFFIIVFAFVLGGCNSAKDIGGMYHLISDDPAFQRVTLEIKETRVSGQGPCNRYFGSITHPDADSNSIQVGPIALNKNGLSPPIGRASLFPRFATRFYGHSCARWAGPNDQRSNEVSL